MGSYASYSVLMSLYRKENPEHFRLAMESVVRQTVPPTEIVLVEDGPLTEELYAVVRTFHEQFPDLLQVVVNETNLGLGKSLRKGLAACHNELVARMDTDDIAVPDRCEKQLCYMEEHPDVSIVGGQIEEFIGSVDRVVGKRIVPTTNDALHQYTKERCPFNHMTVMFRKGAVEAVGSYQHWFWNEDYYLWIRMALADCGFGNLDDTLVYVRVGEEMYGRRGGWAYFESEAKLQCFMLKNGLIGLPAFLMNCAKRFVVQLLLPNKLRGWVYRKFARN